jgi:hypothetical protein
MMPMNHLESLVLDTLYDRRPSRTESLPYVFGEYLVISSKLRSRPL